jgi:hypothetical protein
LASKKRSLSGTNLASRVDDFAIIISILEVDSLGKRGFNCRVVGLDEFVVAILDN